MARIPRTRFLTSALPCHSIGCVRAAVITSKTAMATTTTAVIICAVSSLVLGRVYSGVGEGRDAAALGVAFGVAAFLVLDVLQLETGANSIHCEVGAVGGGVGDGSVSYTSHSPPSDE